MGRGTIFGGLPVAALRTTHPGWDGQVQPAEEGFAPARSWLVGPSLGLGVGCTPASSRAVQRRGQRGQRASIQKPEFALFCIYRLFSAASSDTPPPPSYDGACPNCKRYRPTLPHYAQIILSPHATSPTKIVGLAKCACLLARHVQTIGKSTLPSILSILSILGRWAALLLGRAIAQELHLRQVWQHSSLLAALNPYASICASRSTTSVAQPHESVTPAPPCP